MISLRLDLSNATVGELTKLLDAARAAGAQADTTLQLDGNILEVAVPAGAKAEPRAEQRAEEGEVIDAGPASEARYGGLLGPLVSEEFVRGVVDAVIYDRTKRR